MKIFLTSIFVDDQQKALDFYTEIMGFEVKEDVSLGEYRWLTLTSPDEPDGTQLLLEPNANPTAETYQDGLLQQNIPAAMFSTENLEEDFAKLTAHGVEFITPPMSIGNIKMARFFDTCGNIIQLNQHVY